MRAPLNQLNLKLIHIDSHHNQESPSPHTKEVDFFKEHTIHPSEPAVKETNGVYFAPVPLTIAPTQPLSIANGTEVDHNTDLSEGPNVEAALSMSPTHALAVSEPRKVTIGARKAPTSKKGLGAKKGMGAQKVAANFNDIENAAQQRDKDREQLTAMSIDQEAKIREAETKQLGNMKLAYKDLSLEEKKRDEQIKKMDPKKKAQVERLGMGFGGARESSHSVTSEMKTIEQEDAHMNIRRSALDSLNSRKHDYEDDEFEMLGGFSSGPPKYSENPFGLKSQDRYSNFSSSKSSWDSDKFSSGKTTNAIEDISTHNKSKDDDRGRSRKNYESADGDSAQKKFGNAKAISSDAYFGKNDPDLDMKQKLSKYEGSQGISSADLFGQPQQNSRQDYYNTGPDFADIKEGVRQGVTKVAGRLSNLANGVISSMQDNYG